MLPGFGKLCWPIARRASAAIPRSARPSRFRRSASASSASPEPEGHRAWQEVSRAAGRGPTARRPTATLVAGRRSPRRRADRGRSLSLSATLPRVWQGVGYRPLPARRARALFDFAAIPWPDRLTFAWGAWMAAATGERLVGAAPPSAHHRRHAAAVVRGRTTGPTIPSSRRQLLAAAIDHAHRSGRRHPLRAAPGTGPRVDPLRFIPCPRWRCQPRWPGDPRRALRVAGCSAAPLDAARSRRSRANSCG